MAAVLVRRIGCLAERERIRLLNEGDINDAVGLSSAAGWNQTADDWRMLLALAPDGCMVIEAEDQVVATATLLCYGNRLGWIGMVLTKAEYRGRGFARRLLKHAVDRADELGIETLKLDATEQGQPLYEKLGFRAEQDVERWSKGSLQSITGAVPTPHINDVDECGDLDAFGVDRSQLLRKLASRRAPFKSQGGFLFSRPGRIASYVGPFVAKDETAACELVEQCFRTYGGNGWCWDVLPANRKAVALAGCLGFEPSRRLLRMVRGKQCRGREELIYAIAGFELG
jgi:GNAT superfamily N-acetyltransferase